MDTPLYNSRIIDAYIRLIKSKYTHVDIAELLNYSDMKDYQVADQGHWFTQSQINLFYEKLVQLTGEEHIAREAGRFAASPEALGAMRHYVLGLIGPASTFELINKLTTNFTRSSRYESKKISSNKVEIIVTPQEGVAEEKFQCENRTGFFEAIILMFNFKKPHINHSECIFTGGQVCRYVITWENAVSMYLKRIGYSVTLVFVLATLYLLLTKHFILLEKLIHLFIPLIAGVALAVIWSEKKELKASLENTMASTDSLVEQINSNYNNAQMTNEIGQVLGRYTNTQEVLSNVSRIMEKRLNYDRGLILIANPEGTKLDLKSGYGYSNEHLGLLDSVSFNLDNPESKGIFTVSFREQRPFLINDLNEIEENLSPKSLEFAKKVGTQTFICCPIVCEGKSVGLLAVDNVKTKKPLVQSDISLLMGVASVIGISLRNADLIEARVRQFNSVLQVLAASIDARDSLTAGHSEMVTEYTVGICRELNLSPDECETIRVAALLHDYGKIGVPDAILKKEGLLSPEEYAIVKTHASKTREILSQISFEGIYCGIPEIAGAHHEKFDGSGYPEGLKGKDIPLGARIIAVADYFEAITAKRHYREPMRLEDAFQAVFDEGGRSFDKLVVDAFLSYYARTRQYVSSNEAELSRFSDRRRLRVPAAVPVSFWLNGKICTASSEDLSMRGIFVASEEAVSEGCPVDLAITLPDIETVIEAKGRVAWVNSGQLKKATMSNGFGVEIVEFKEMAERIMEAFVSRWAEDDCLQESG